MGPNLFPLFNQISTILITFFGLFLAFWVYLANRKSRMNQSFFWLAIFISLWIVFSFFGNTSTNQDFATLLGRLAYGSVALLFIPFYYFPIFFLKEEKKHPLLNILVIISCFFLFIFSVFTKLMVVGMDFTKFGAIPILGEGKFIYFGVLAVLIIFIIRRFVLNYVHFSRRERLKIQYFLMGFLIWVFMNLIFNIVLPVFQRTPQFWMLGNYSGIFLLAFTAYAIVKQELFGIKVVITVIFVALIAILLALDTLAFTTDIYLRILKGGALVIFLYFGYLMIRSVMREIKQRQEIEKLSKAKSEFISIASHQLRTPLTAIKGYISMILEGVYGELGGKIKRPMKNVYDSNERLIRLVNDLLSLSRIESGKMQMAWEKTSIEDLISSVISVFRIEAQKKKIFLKFEKPKRHLPKILIDPDKIREVISNIVSNAIKYTEKGGITIRVKVMSLAEKKFLGRKPSKDKGQKLGIEFSDTGAGMTEDEISKVFESFSRGVAGTKLFTRGAGLGLYISRRFIGMHKGKIWIESAGRDKGSTFYIELPMK